MQTPQQMSTFAIHITNDPGFENETWGPYGSVRLCEEVIASFVGVPESARIVKADSGTVYTGRPE